MWIYNDLKFKILILENNTIKATLILLTHLWFGQGSVGIARLWSTCVSLDIYKAGGWNQLKSFSLIHLLTVDAVKGSWHCLLMDTWAGAVSPYRQPLHMAWTCLQYGGWDPRLSVSKERELWKACSVTSAARCSLRQSGRPSSFMEKRPYLMGEWEGFGRACGTRNITVTIFCKIWCVIVSKDWLSLSQIYKTGHSYLVYMS